MLKCDLPNKQTLPPVIRQSNSITTTVHIPIVKNHDFVCGDCLHPPKTPGPRPVT